MIDEEGKVGDVKMIKSVEYTFDEEVMKVISSAKEWVPASKNGKKLKAFRQQPFTISLH